jgi:F-type H+-transporting ATPase subunit delta
MKEDILSKRYAEGFIAYAQDTIGLSQAVSEFKALKWIISQNPDFLGFLTNPEIMYHEKYAFIEKVLDEQFSVDIRNFIKLLVEKRRVGFLSEIADYVRVHYGHGGALEAVVTTTYPLDLDIISAIKMKLEKKLQRTLNLYLQFDPDLKGGIQVTIGNMVLDGSVRKRLIELKETLQRARIG